MCLRTRQSKNKVALHDIVCWKSLEIIKNNSGNMIYVTPYMFKHVPDDVLSGRKPFCPDPDGHGPIYTLVEGAENLVYGEYIHTYGLLSDKRLTEAGVNSFAEEIEALIQYIGKYENFMSKKVAERLNCPEAPDVIGVALFKCVIPKGVEYLRGTTDGTTEDEKICSYASKRIVFKKKVYETFERYPEDFSDRISEIIAYDRKARGLQPVDVKPHAVYRI